MKVPVDGECIVHGLGAGVESLAAKLTGSADSRRTVRDAGNSMLSVIVETIEKNWQRMDTQ